MAGEPFDMHNGQRDSGATPAKGRTAASCVLLERTVEWTPQDSVALSKMVPGERRLKFCIVPVTWACFVVNDVSEPCGCLITNVLQKPLLFVRVFVLQLCSWQALRCFVVENGNIHVYLKPFYPHWWGSWGRARGTILGRSVLHPFQKQDTLILISEHCREGDKLASG